MGPGPEPGHSPAPLGGLRCREAVAAARPALPMLIPRCCPTDAPHPQTISCRGARDIAPSQGTAVLPLSPIARGSEAAR